MELGLENGKNKPPWVIVGLMESDGFDEQTRDNSAFEWLPVSSAVCSLGSDGYPDNYMNFVYPTNDFHGSSYGLIFLFLKHTKDRVVIPF